MSKDSVPDQETTIFSKSDVTTEGVLELVQYSPNVEDLNVNHCDKIDKYGFDALFAAYSSKLINLGKECACTS